MLGDPDWHIPKDELEDGAYYEGECRNASIARWNAKEQKFYHWRYKFGNEFIETIKAPEDEKNYDVFFAFKKITTPEKGIDFKEV